MDAFDCNDTILAQQNAEREGKKSPQACCYIRREALCKKWDKGKKRPKRPMF